MKDKKSLGYILGTAFGTVITICVMVLIVVLTYKFVTWIL